MNSSIAKYQFKEGVKLGFEILDIYDAFIDKNKMMVVPHRAQFYHILYIEKGKANHFVDFKQIEISDNTILFIPQNSVNKFDPNGNYEGKAIIFTDSFFCKNNDDRMFLQSSILFSDLYPTATLKFSKEHNDLRIILNAIETEYARMQDKEQYQILHNMIHIFLLQAEREMRKQGTTELKPSANLDYLISFKDLLEQNFKQEKSVNKYASDLNISEKQLHKATKSLLDKTPKQIIDERVLLEAKRLLVHSNQSIKEIAYELGYDEPTNFIKYFRKHIGITPVEFREQN